MATLVLPEGGLTLQGRGLSEDSSSDTGSKPSQIMRLNLAQNTLDELVASLRNDQKARIRLGKHQTLHYGNKSQSFYSSPTSVRSELYLSSPVSKENIYFSGTLSHTLEVRKAQEATAATDEALANLEQSLSAFERGKESKRTQLITSVDQMKALGAGDNRTATGREAASLARKPTSKIDAEKERFFKNAANRSTSASPALLAARSPASLTAVTPTSATIIQNKDKIRLDALRVPFIHLLAIRPVSAKFLAKQTRCSQSDCLALTRKYCVENRNDREKFDLRDKVYKELDVWNFPYPTQEDRLEAIENAVSAFDRMRISRTDKLWQLLLPKEERGKGKVLSRLNLTKGPMTKSVTPRIQVQPSEEPAEEGDVTGNESERTNGGLTPNDAKSGSAAQKKRVSEKPATSKRATSKPKNTTLTGKVTKKTDKKSSTKPDGKFKSSEYVQESDDEDTEMIDSSTLESSGTGMATTARSATAPSQKPTKATSTYASKEPGVETSKAAAVKSSQPSKKLPSSTATSRSNNNISPSKPSPLGSSPPTNASEFDNGTNSSNTTNSSNSSSPLISQLPKHKAASIAKSTSQAPPRVNGSSKPLPTSNPLKRKADDHADVSTGQTIRHAKPRPIVTAKTNGHIEPKRRRPSSPSSGSTTGSASPPLTHEIMLQRLRDKSNQFKRYYAKYRTLHEELTANPDPPRSQVEILERQHDRLQRMKDEIWAEHRRLRK